ncbi:hypothetical protein BEWA_018890 [Theileria equi strain WA]|uniref:C2 domain-containing protein n=1 Tax=Theileria equi strain WA TaxID=1537102 RepID=L0AVX4_THEEQ|nr:hypothetical protein BEWA_018890 [Theileria equi strain WA]AFZ79044.1 hypothetical protein BEWA_018890 [Theileria equi strain WA]|eukprot:XP_004828710.1 hypothetical protein BEWA_018890 [Theileria equi strain WA]
MVRLEIWKPKRPSEYNDSEDSQKDEKAIPLFDNTDDKIRIKTFNSPDGIQPTSRVESNEAEDKNYFESEYSDLDGESSTDNGEYAAEWNKLQLVRAFGNQASHSTYNADLVPRVWHSVFYISTIHNLENVTQKYFYSINVGHINESINSQSVRRSVMYTPSYTLKPGERITLKLPIFIWKKRQLVIPYAELKNYVIRIEMWKTRKLQLNTLYSSQTITFKEIIESKSNFTITLNLNVGNNNSQSKDESLRNKNSVTKESEKKVPVHKLNVVMLLEEIFDFVFVFENWWFTGANTLPRTFINAPKTLKISVQSGTGKRWITRSTGSSYDDYWSSPGTFTFRGTLRQMKISYFVVKVYAINNNKFWNKGQLLLGTCVMSLKSVKEYPLVRGIVKKLAIGTKNMQSGTIQGNIRCCVKSASVQFFEDLKTRPAQPISGSALLTHLDHKGQYLVIRILRCENLPSTNSDSNTSDPMIKVKWDGIVNCTCSLESTTSPVYNQNMYFPIHLVDSKELSDPALIKYSLPIDLASKGPVIIEAWDHDDTSSEFLGGAEVHLSKLYTDGVLHSRSLVDGIFNEASQKSYSNDYDTGNNAEISYYSEFSNGVHIQHITRVYADTIPLSGFTVPHSGSKPSITFEMYILPPMPDDLYISEGQKKAVKSDIYHDLGRRWNKDFEIWQRIYNDKIPRSITKRRFLCITTSNAATRDKLPSEVLPLCYFVSPIQISSQLSSPGELLHWISNFTVREEGIAKFCGFEHIDTWQHPSRMLMTRKGGLHDRALLLCSCLLGLGYDAYVCKGTTSNGLREHCWVMTRHADSTVSFWETGNKRIWHLPNRWKNQTHTKNSESVGKEPYVPIVDNYVPIQHYKINKPGFCTENILTEGLAKYELYGIDYLADEKVDLSHIINKQDEIDYDTTAISANFRSTSQAFPKKKKRADKKYEAIQPREELMIPSKTLVLLPYSSIETVFNHKQIWGNIQNHHPACIFYNLDAEAEWRKFLKAPIDEIPDSNIQITPPPSETICEDTSKDILNDITDMIELMRAKRGLTCAISTDQQMSEKLEAFIDLLEFRQRLDPQFDPGMPPHLLGWSNKDRQKKIIQSINQHERIKMTKGIGESTTSLNSTDVSESSHEVRDMSENNTNHLTTRVIEVPSHARSINEQHTDVKFKIRIRNRVSIQTKNNKKSKYKVSISRDLPLKKRTKNAVLSYFKVNVDYKCGENCHKNTEGSETPMSNVSSNAIDNVTQPRNGTTIEYMQLIRQTYHSQAPPNADRVNAPKISGNFSNISRGNRHRFSYDQNRTMVKKARKKIFSLIGRKRNKVPDHHSMPRFAQDMKGILPVNKSHKAFYPEYKIPSEFKVYEQKQFSLWNWYYQLEAMQYGWQKKSGYLPIPPNHTFIGIPIHFSTSDVNEIRNLLTCTKRFKKIIVNDVDKPIYVTYVKVFPLLGGILSTWIFIGCHVPWKM